MRSGDSMRGGIRRGFGGLAAGLALALSLAVPAAAAPGYETGHRLVMASEPGEQSPYTEYYEGETPAPAERMVWTDGGVEGQALSLSGQGEFLRIRYAQLQVHAITVAGWFRWRGAAEGADEAAAFQQRLFTLYRNDQMWLSVKPRWRDFSRTDADGKSPDGVYMAFSMGQGDETSFFDFWNPVTPNRENYGLPLNEWHHVAMTMDGQYLRLYVDGTLWFERLLVLGVEEMRAGTLDIGAGRWGEPTLNALVDDVVVYDAALTAGQIDRLKDGGDPMDDSSATRDGAWSLPSDVGAGLTDVSSAGLTEEADIPKRCGFSKVPGWIGWMAGGLVAVILLLSFLLSRRPPAPGGGQGGDRHE